MQPLLEQLAEECQSKPSMLRTAAWVLGNCCRGKKPKPDFSLVRTALPTLGRLLASSTDEEVLAGACWALSYLSDGDDVQVQALVETKGAIERLVELLSHSSSAVQTPALRAVGNAVAGNEQQTQAVVDASALPELSALLGSPKVALRKEACWAISNITAGSRGQIQAVIDAGIIPPVAALLQSDPEEKVQKEAEWVIKNAVSGGTPEQKKVIEQQSLLPRLQQAIETRDLHQLRSV
jgi:importin subunit alpha-1